MTTDGVALSVPSPAVAGFGGQSPKKSGRRKLSPNHGEGEKREKKSGRWPNPGPSPDAKQVVTVYKGRRGGF